jgi:ABC-type nitrate/sulfonate/bicarbonate transport system ATPase subunit
MVGLSDFATSYPAQLSAARGAGLHRAHGWSCNRALILLDEPFA